MQPGAARLRATGACCGAVAAAAIRCSAISSATAVAPNCATASSTRAGSTSATCWRRISRFEESGVIRKRVALLDRNAVGLGIMIFANVKLATQDRQTLETFEQAIRSHPAVLECHVMMGEWDVLLRIVARDIKHYEAFRLDHLSKLPHLQSISASIALIEVKYTTELPLTP
jgi:Lrp/AsnC family transcriptional regulator